MSLVTYAAHEAIVKCREYLDRKMNSPCKNNVATRRVLNTAHNKLFYRVKGKTIYILTFFDTRQDPRKRISMGDPEIADYF